jgi:hypothetical protein
MNENDNNQTELLKQMLSELVEIKKAAIDQAESLSEMLSKIDQGFKALEKETRSVYGAIIRSTGRP